ncbi:VOC family protein [Nodosilinea sp. E11]|uniref:VOC family protein n=1 Tax=Nodosilinea sp. E11 TaxID=3037479 RepID=UPI002935035D|nr:VOC family protein [Nodosilinea sp. E11]WOD39231.1 VOC family protein [Nodosilinea sp. E11]
MNPFQQPGAFSWCELVTPDVAAAKAFYGPLFGWTLKEGPLGDTPYTVIEVEGKEIGGMAPPPPNQANMPPTWGVYITVEDVDAIAAQATALGGQVLLPPLLIEGTGKFTLIRDPQGATFCAIEYAQRS